MASATEIAPPPPTPPVGGRNPAARVLSERLGGKVLKAEDFRGDLAITVDRRAWVEAVRLLRDHPELRDVGRLTLWQSMRCVQLVLWDERRRRLVSFRDIGR